jgi:thiamine-monophosphate kinase
MFHTRTELAALGEFGFINHIHKQIKIYNSSTQKGIGDDAAVIQPTSHEVTLVSTDLLVEKIHFDLTYTPLKHLGYKAIAVNVSDIAAMNGKPEQITVGIAVSNRFSMEALDELYAGMRLACEQYHVDIVGGDTTSSTSGLVIAITVIGKAQPQQVVYRNTARPNDIICVTGDLGAAYLGLQLLEREKQEFLVNPSMQPQLSDYEYVIGRQLKPEARMDIIYELAEMGVVPTAMIDISDGLASEILHICSQSKVGAIIFEDKIPLDKETYDVALNQFSLEPTTCALNGGEDYELLFTISQKNYEKIKNHADISFIGYITEGTSAHLVTRGNQQVPLQAQGWQHF